MLLVFYANISSVQDEQIDFMSHCMPFFSPFHVNRVISNFNIVTH